MESFWTLYEKGYLSFWDVNNAAQLINNFHAVRLNYKIRWSTGSSVVKHHGDLGVSTQGSFIWGLWSGNWRQHEVFTLDGRKYKYTCRLCSRTLSSKQRVLMHLHTAHHKSKFSLSLEIGLSLPTTQILVVIFHLEISIWMAQQIDSDNL